MPFLFTSFLTLLSTLLSSLLLTLMLNSSDAQAQEAPLPAAQHAIAMHGDVKYPADFKQFEYVNIHAPKGGTLKLHARGSFDSFNAHISKGVPADGTNLLYETLVTQSLDEAFSVYGLIAESFHVPEDRSWIIFNLRKNARFSDGEPITAADVIFSFNLLRDKGKPQYQFYYLDVESVTALTDHQVKFTFKHSLNRELALTVGTFPIFPKHYWKERAFEAVNLEIPLGSGAYKIKNFQPGKNVVFEKDPNYWGEELAINQGRNNFKKIIYEYYLDQNISIEAFKAGDYHYRSENNSKFWATSYTGDNFDNHKIVREEIEHQQPVGMQAFVFNLRKPLFGDKVLRQAISYAFDFEWSNKNLFYGQYRRSRSFFQNTELAAEALPSESELKILEPFRKDLPPQVFNELYSPPNTEGDGNVRKNLRIASKLLKQAGYNIKNQKLYTPKGKPVTFEFLMYDSAFERIVLPMVRNLKTLGIIVTPRKIDLNQYIERLREYKFDMVVTTFSQSPSPGNEQKNMWTSSAAEKRDTQNLLGLKDPIVDKLVEQLIQAKDRDVLINQSRALDRVLQWGHYVIPNWHVNYHRLAYWSHLKHPEIIPPYGLDLLAWWSTDTHKPAGQ